MKPRLLAIIVGLLLVAVLSMLVLPLPQPIIELAPEKVFSIGGLNVTNTILTSWIMVAVISIGLILGTRKLSLENPRGFQNLFEAVVEGFSNLTNSVAGEKNGRRFFPVVFILFTYIVLCNWAALTPLFNVIGVVEDEGAHIRHEATEHPDFVVKESEKLHGWIMKRSGGITLVPFGGRTRMIEVEVPAGTTYLQRCILMEGALAAELGRSADPARACSEEGHGEGSALAANERYAFIAPFLRGVNTDLNAPLSFAIWSAIFVEFWGITALGLFKYGGKFFNFQRLLKGDIVNGIIDVFVGILELISELSRLISFTFRLFGNIIAGEILLFMMSFLVPLLLITVFYGLELFVGLIQGFVFAMLTLVFAVMAVTSHGDHEGEHGHGHDHEAAVHHDGAVRHEASHA